MLYSRFYYIQTTKIRVLGPIWGQTFQHITNYMITLISGTNRPNNATEKVAKAYFNLLKQKDDNALFFSLQELPATPNIHQLYSRGNNEFTPFAEKYINNAEKLVIFTPEYNGSFSGILKLFLDTMPHKTFAGKTIALVGTGNGRGGNLRGLEQLTGIFHYLEANVLWYKIPVSGLNKLFDVDGNFTDEAHLKAFEKQIDLLIAPPL